MRQVSATAERAFDMTDVLADVEHALHGSPPLREKGPIAFAPPAVRTPQTPLPMYLEHREGADEIGKLSAEAVGRSYELAAQEIEKMGEELKERTRLCEEMVVQSNSALDLIKETAAQFRDAGKILFLRIEDNATMTREVREMCDTLQKKIAGPPS